MNENAILHIPDSRFCFAISQKELVIRLRTAKEDEKAQVYLVYGCKYDFATIRNRVKMEICYRDRLFDYYEITLTLADVRIAYIFEFSEGEKTSYYSEDGLTDSYNFEEGFYNFFQMPYINRNDMMETVDWMRDAVFYQIFVDRFAIGNEEKDKSYINMKWGDIPTPKSFAGGDLKGITQKLDYIDELGVNALYLTPIFESVSNHKYDIMDYRKIDSHFGNEKDFRELVTQAHKKGIRVILDAVFNHCSEGLSQFQDVLKRGKESPYFDWFIISGDYPDKEKGNYECFAACTYMPKLNTANEKVQEFLIDTALYWMREFQIDGWRLDVSDEVSHDFWRKFRKAIKTENSQAVIIGENWHDAYPYLMGDQYDSIMNYAFTKACLDYFARGVFGAKDMAEKLNSNLMRNMTQVNRMMLNLLDSHDTHRFYTEIGKNKDKLLAAVALEMIFMGTPCIYYGTEQCMEGGYDPDSRRCFSWEKDTWDYEFLEHFKRLTGLRKETVLQWGDIKVFAYNEMLCVERAYRDEKITLFINLTEKERKTGKERKDMLFENHTDKDSIQTNGYAVYKENRKEV